MRKLNDLEQHLRKDNVLMFGVSDVNKLETAENTVDVVVKVGYSVELMLQ